MLAALLLASLAAQDHAPVFPSPDEEGAASLVPKRPCRATPDAITVCGDPNGMRLPTLDEARFTGKPLRPGFRIPGGGRGSVVAAQRSVGGVSAPAAMVTVSIPLGRKPRKDDEAEK